MTGRALVALAALMVMGLPAPAQANHGDCVVDLSPETDSNVLGQTHVVTATLRPAGTDVNGTSTAICSDHQRVTINFEISGSGSPTYSPSGIDAGATGVNDLSCSLQPNDDSCTISYSRTSVTGTDTILGQTEDTPTVSDTVTKTWTAAAPSFLNVSPETDTNPLGAEHTLTATVRSSSGALSSGVVVDFEVIDGPNENLDGDVDEPDLSCTTGSGGTCSVSYDDDEATNGEIDTVCAWLDTDSDDVFDDGGSNADGGDCDSESNSESEDSSISGTDTYGNDVTDKVTKTWSTSGTAGTAVYLNITPESDTNPLGTVHTLTASARDANGNLVSGAVIDFEVTVGPNEDLDSDSDSPDRSCTTGSNGTCTTSYTDADADSGDFDVICGWIDTDTDDLYDLTAGDADGGDCDDEATNESEDSSVGGTDTYGSDETDEVTKTWGASSGDAVLVNVTPETSDNPLREEHTLTATARDATGNLVTGANVDFEVIDGPNADLDEGDTDLDCTTGSSGTCTVTYDDTSASVGDQDEICGWLDDDGDDEYVASGSDEDGGDCDDEDDGESEDSSVSGSDVYGNDVTDVVVKNWIASSDAFYLNITPENAVNAPGTEHTITAVAHDQDGNLSVGVSIDFEVIRGPNANLDNNSGDADLECITNSAGTCSVSYNDASNGGTANNVDTICGWLDIEDDDDLALGGAISDGGACDEETTGEPEDSGDPGRDEFGNDATDTVTKTWSAQDLPAACLAEGAIIGSDEAETLIGTPGNDVICGLGGADSILGYGGDDRILSGGGPDNIRGGAGNDVIGTGGGDDVAVGQAGNDTIRGRVGDDYLLGSSGNDSLRGGVGADVLDGGRDVDFCRGGPGRDRRLRCEL